MLARINHAWHLRKRGHWWKDFQGYATRNGPDRDLQWYASWIGICIVICKLHMKEISVIASGMWICSDMQAGYGFAIICKEDRDLQWFASEIGPHRDLHWYARGKGICSNMHYASWIISVICQRDRNSTNAGIYHQLAWGYPRVAAGCKFGSRFRIMVKTRVWVPSQVDSVLASRSWKFLWRLAFTHR